MTVNNSFINPATLYCIATLFIYMYAFKIKRALLLIFFPFFLRIIFGKFFSDSFLTDDEFSYYFEHLKIINGTSTYTYNYYHLFSSKLFQFFGHDLSTIRSFNALGSTIIVNYLYNTLISKRHLHTSFREKIFHYFPTFILLSSTTTKENFVGIGLVLLSIFPLLNTRAKQIGVGILGLIVALVYRRYIIGFSAVSSLISIFFTTANKHIKILAILMLFLVPPVTFFVKKNTIINLYKVYKISIEENKTRDSSTMNKIFLKAKINNPILRSLLSIIRSLWSPSPIKPLRDYLKGKQKINSNWVLDSLINSVVWYVLLPFFVIYYIYLVKTKSNILFLANIFLINHIAAATNDVIWIPQFVRYRLPGLIIFSALSLLCIFNRQHIYQFVSIKIRNTLWVGWISLSIIYNIFYLLF